MLILHRNIFSARSCCSEGAAQRYMTYITSVGWHTSAWLDLSFCIFLVAFHKDTVEEEEEESVSSVTASSGKKFSFLPR